MENTQELEMLHKNSYEILKFLDRVCKEQNFKYFLAFGTLLGAVRHEGFIPWDDDVDVWMERREFMKLYEFLKTKNDDPRFKLNVGEHRLDGDSPSVFQLRILDTETKITRVYAEKQVESYLWIDIFALDEIPYKKRNSYIRKFKRRLFWYKVARCKTFYIKNKSFYSKMNKIVYTLHNKFGFFKRTLKEDKAIDKAYRALTKYQGSPDAKHYFTYAAVYLDKPHKCIYEKEWFDGAVDLTFEDQKFPTPKNSHEVLKTLYNDYMTIPKEHERHTHSVKSAEAPKEN